MDLTDYIDSFVEENYGEVSISDTAYHFFMLGKKQAEEQMMAKAIEGSLCSTICGSEQNVVAPAGYGEYGKDGDKVKVIVFKEDWYEI